MFLLTLDLKNHLS